MGRVTVTFELSNYWDLQQLEHGKITPDKVRRVAMQGVVDTGATRLILPEAIARQLGLPVTGLVTTRYGDHREATREVAKDAYVQVMGRGGVFNAVLEPARTEALLGAIVMEDLDLMVDCSGQKLLPRDPNTLITEIE